MAKSRTRKKRKAIIVESSKQAPAKKPQRSTNHPATPILPTVRRRWFRYIAGIFGLPITVIGLIASIYQILGGPPWPTDPDVRPHDVSDNSSFVLPFTIRNRSTLFDMNHVAMTCGIDMVAISDSQNKLAGAAGVAFFTGYLSFPAGSSVPVNYRCDASDLFQVKADGSISIRDTLSSRPAALVPPVKIVKMCVWIGGDYRIGTVRRSFTSAIFKWPASQTARQWIEGPMGVDEDRPKKLPTNNPDDLECSPSVKGPYAYVKGFGPPMFPFDIIRERPLVTGPDK